MDVKGPFDDVCEVMKLASGNYVAGFQIGSEMTWFLGSAADPFMPALCSCGSSSTTLSATAAFSCKQQTESLTKC